MNTIKACPLWHCCVALLASIAFTGCGREPIVAESQTKQSVSAVEVEPAYSVAGGGGSSEMPDPPMPTSQPSTPPSVPEKTATEPATQISSDAFRIAAYEGQLETVRKAIEEGGADVNGADPVQSLTALHMAAYRDHMHVVRYLVENGADTAVRDRRWNSYPLGWAIAGRNFAIRDYLMEYTPID